MFTRYYKGILAYKGPPSELRPQGAVGRPYLITFTCYGCHLHGAETGSVVKTKLESKTGPKLAAVVHTVPASPGSQSTLKANDLDATWQGPPARTENVPMPRRAPHRKV